MSFRKTEENKEPVEQDTEQEQKTEPQWQSAQPPFEIPVPYYTYLMVAAIVCVYLIQMEGDFNASLEKGAFVKPLFLEGEYGRFFSGFVMHGSLMHIFFNSYALYSFGNIFETLSNRAHLPIVVLLSAIMGNVASLAFNPEGASVGASGGVIGLLGYIAIYVYKRRQFLNPAFSKNIIFNVGFVLVIGLLLSSVIDNYAHIGGIVTGAVYGFIQIPTDPFKDPRNAGAFADSVGIICLGIFLCTALLTSLYLIGFI